MRATLTVLPREMRLLTERIFLLTALPMGFVPAIVDAVILSHCLGLGGFALLERRFGDLEHADPRAIRVDGQRHIDACGQHAWTAIPAALDLLAEQLADGGPGTITVEHLLDAKEMAVAAALGQRQGLCLAIDGARLSARPAAWPADGLDPTFRNALFNGASVEAELWWRLYRLSNTALAPDSPMSRRHAGPLIVTEDGQVLGRTDNDDDTDIAFIKAGIKAGSGTA